jgi:hypothetical protein
MSYIPKFKRRELPSNSEKLPVTLLPTLTRPVSKTELSTWLDVSERFLELEVRAGRLRALKLGARALRFLPNDVQAWLESKETASV